MKRRILGFIDELRHAGLVPGPGESMDAVRAVAEMGVERPVLRACLAATLIKDHADRPTFDQLFDRYFSLPEGLRGRKKGDPAQKGERGNGRRGEAETRSTEPRDRRLPREPHALEQPSERTARLLAQRRSLLTKPFHQMDPTEVEELRDSMRDLAGRFRRHCGRRRRSAARGRLDMRRTIRRALAHGGVPVELMLRRRRPRKADLVALVDLSFSTVTAAEFLLSLLAPSRTYFRRVNLFAYVDAPVEISFERGYLVPHSPLDLHARSDFGNVLRRLDDEACDLVLGRNTVVLVLGDARNNRRPPRADLLARLGRRVLSVVWLNPEDPSRWNTGDSVMATYAKHVHLLLPASNPSELLSALSRVVRRSIG